MCIETRNDYLDLMNDIDTIYDAVSLDLPIRQGQIRYVNLGEQDPDSRSSMGKSRPCIVVQNDYYNDIPDATVYVLPLSSTPMYNSKSDKLIAIKILGKTSLLCFNTLVAVERSVIGNCIHTIPDELMTRISQYYYERIVCNKLNTDCNLLNRNLFTKKELVDDSEFEDYKVYGERFLHNKISPQYINTMPIAVCKNFLIIYEALGIDYFKASEKYEEKTFEAAIKRAKSRVSSFSKIPLEEVIEY